MSKRRRDTGSPFLQSLCEDETLTSFHKLLLNKFDSIISFLQRIDEKVYSIDKRLSYLELKDKESPEHDRKTERTESPPLPQNPPPVSINHPPVVIHNPVTVSPVQIPAESHHRPSISDLPSTSASAAISTTIIKEEFVDDDESSHSIMEIEDLQNLAAKSEAIEIEDVSYILPEGSLNDTNSSYTHHERESMDGHSHQVFPQGSFNCLELGVPPNQFTVQEEMKLNGYFYENVNSSKPPNLSIEEIRNVPTILNGNFFVIKNVERYTNRVEAVCTFCKREYRAALSATTNFLNHLRRYHPEKLEEYFSSTQYRSNRNRDRK